MADKKAIEFRNALGAFATGVTVITTLSDEGEPVGVTASSFNSVSLDPPLVLWSLAKNSLSKVAFCNSGHFAIHVLSSKQEDISNIFAKSGGDKFSGIAWKTGENESPILDEYAALFECKTMHQYEGGDHIILIGEVLNFDQRDELPLLFHGGQYAETRPKLNSEPVDAVDIDEGRFTEDFLLYLISRAHFQSSRPTHLKLEELNLSQREYMTLAVLSMNAPASENELAERLDHTGFSPDAELLDQMALRMLIDMSDDGYELTTKGRKYLMETLAVAKAAEDDLLDHFSHREVADTKRVLKKIIELTGADIPDLWNSTEENSEKN